MRLMNRQMMVIAMGIAFVTTSCHSNKGDKEEKTIYTVTNPFLTNTTLTKDYVADIKSLKNIEIRAQVKGFLQEVCVDEGQYVKAGQILFKITPAGYADEVAKSKAEVDQSKIEYANASTLVSNNVVSKNAKAMALAKLQGSQAELRLSQLYLKLTVIRAPFNGIINRIPKKRGSVIDEGDLLTSLSDNSSVYAYFNLSEPEYLDFQTQSGNQNKQPVELILANGNQLGVPGYIQTIDGEFNNETGSISLRAKFSNPKLLLRNGQTGKVRMTIPLSHALIIPQESTYEIQDKKFVFVVDSKNIVHAREIEISNELPSKYIVSKGLSASDRFLVDGAQKVNDGDQINFRYKAPEKVLQGLVLNAN